MTPLKWLLLRPLSLLCLGDLTVGIATRFRGTPFLWPRLAVLGLAGRQVDHVLGPLVQVARAFGLFLCRSQYVPFGVPFPEGGELKHFKLARYLPRCAVVSRTATV